MDKYKEIILPKLLPKLRISNTEGDYQILIGSTEIGKFKLKKFPYCSGICILCDVNINPEFKSLGIGNVILSLAIEEATNSNYAYLICTDVTTNTPMRKLLNKFGFNDVLNFNNLNTSNNVNLSVKNLR